MNFFRHSSFLWVSLILAGCASAPPETPVVEARLPKPVVQVLVPVVPPPPSEVQVMAAVDDESNVFFGLGETAVDALGREKLKHHAERLKANPKLVVALVGHTDDLGSPSYNLAIAAQRVSEVREQLRRYGVRSSQIRRQVGGREKLEVTCRSTECRSRMRRVKLDYVE